MISLGAPVDTIKDHIKRGYTVELIANSKQPSYTVRMFTHDEVKSFTVHPSEASIEDLYKATKSL